MEFNRATLLAAMPSVGGSICGPSYDSIALSANSVMAIATSSSVTTEPLLELLEPALLLPLLEVDPGLSMLGNFVLGWPGFPPLPPLEHAEMKRVEKNKKKMSDAIFRLIAIIAFISLP